MSLGQLPMLSIGRNGTYDYYDQEDLSDDEFKDNDVKQLITNQEGYNYHPDHVAPTVKALERLFQVPNNGPYVLQVPPQGDVPVAILKHCTAAVPLGQKYLEITKLLEKQALLEFKKDCLMRIKQATDFLHNCEMLVQEECNTWSGICKQTLEEPPNTKLENLGGLCEDLRRIVSSWNCLKQHVHHSKWLRSASPSMVAELQIIFKVLTRVRNSIVWWLRKFLDIGFHVLAHCDPNQLTSDTLWGITRGVEDFNSVVRHLQMEERDVYMSSMCKNYPRTTYTSFQFSYSGNFLACTSEITFHYLLDILSGERSKYAAAMTYFFFTTRTPTLKILRKSHMMAAKWGTSEFLLKNKSSKSHSTGASPSNTSESRESFLPDLSQEDAPLIEFASRERDFTIRFLQILNQSTNMLSSLPQAQVLKAKVLQREHRILLKSRSVYPEDTQSQVASGLMGNFLSMTNIILEAFHHITKYTKGQVSDEPDNSSESSSRSSRAGASSGRKSVTWGDSTENQLLSSLADIYLDLLWQHFTREMNLFWYSPTFAPCLSPGKANHLELLGCITACDTAVELVLAASIEQNTLKDVFPLGSVFYLNNIAKMLKCDAASRAWDAALCQGLSSQLGDKCSPTLTVEAAYATQTAVSLQQAVLPLLTIMTVLGLPKEPLADGVELEELTYVQLLPCMQKLLVTGQLMTDWLSAKAAHFFFKGAFPTYLLIRHCDQKVLQDVLDKATHLSRHACDQGNETRVSTGGQLADIWSQTSLLSTYIQETARSFDRKFADRMKSDAFDFFLGQMPSGKFWKKKNLKELPSTHLPYISEAVDALVEPILCGCSKLPRDAQLEVIQMTITAVCEAWMNAILKQKYKFSYLGALQLGMDVQYFLNWFKNSLVETSQSWESISSLAPVVQLSAVVQLLMDQPQAAAAASKSYSVVPLSIVDGHRPGGRSSEAGTSGAPRANGAKTSNPTLPPSLDMQSDENKIKTVVSNPEQWSALRLEGNSRRIFPKFWKCFV